MKVELTKEQQQAILQAVKRGIPFVFCAGAAGVSFLKLLAYYKTGLAHQTDGLETPEATFCDAVSAAIFKAMDKAIKSGSRTDIVTETSKVVGLSYEILADDFIGEGNSQLSLDFNMPDIEQSLSDAEELGEIYKTNKD